MPTIKCKCKAKKQSDIDIAQGIISKAQKDIHQLIKYSMLLDKLEREINEAQQILSAESEGNT